MGLFNWLHDRRVVEIQNTIKLIESELRILHSRIDTLESHIASLRGHINRLKDAPAKKLRAPRDDEDDEEEINPEVKAFYESTVEFANSKKYKNS